MPALDQTPADLGDRVAVARVLAPWGVKGEVKVARHSRTADPIEPGTRLYLADEQVMVEWSRASGKQLVVKLRGIDDRDAAERLRGSDMEIPESELPPAPEGMYYEFELIGLSAVTPAGDELGTVSEILATGANDVYVIATEDGNQVLVPAIRDVVLRVDTEAGQMVVDPPREL